jgi:hypothetical protein
MSLSVEQAWSGRHKLLMEVGKMISRKRLVSSFAPVILSVAVVAWSACSVNVKKGENEQEKDVDIKTPVGGIHVSKTADVKDLGLSVYPGARPVPKEGDKDEKSANVRISSPLFGLRVVAQEYQSDDAPDKLISYYSNELKKYGKVLECHTTWHGKDVSVHTGHGSDKDSKELTCDNDRDGRAVELKVGTEDHQHLVAIQPEGKGSRFALVFVDVHSKDDTI